VKIFLKLRAAGTVGAGSMRAVLSVNPEIRPYSLYEFLPIEQHFCSQGDGVKGGKRDEYCHLDEPVKRSDERPGILDKGKTDTD
jgi:hypothetical protein